MRLGNPSACWRVARSEPGGYMHAVTKKPLPNTPAKRLLFQYGLGDFAVRRVCANDGESPFLLTNSARPSHPISVRNSQVGYLGTYFMIRSTGAKLFMGNVREANETLYGFEWAESEETKGSIGLGFKYEGVPDVPVENRPPVKDFDVHDAPRREARAQEQMHTFFSTGVIPDPCNGQGCHSPTKLH